MVDYIEPTDTQLFQMLIFQSKAGEQARCEWDFHDVNDDSAYDFYF
jgi:hypothetical protein